MINPSWLVRVTTVSASIVALWMGAAIAQNSAPAMDQYAFSFPIQTTSDASFYSVELPLAVYQSVSDSRLRDAGVYNASGQPVPRVFRSTDDRISNTKHSVVLPFVSLLNPTEDTPEDVRMMFERDGDRTTIELNANATNAVNEPQPPSAHIVDLRTHNHSFDALELGWQISDAGFIGRVIIESSNNLQDWSERGSGAVADLKQAGTHVLRNRISIRPTSDDFLRIRWQNLPVDWTVTKVSGTYDTGGSTAVRRYQILAFEGRDADDNGYLFDLGGAPEIDQLRVVLEQNNTVISATLLYWSEQQQDWFQISSGSHYHLGRGNNSVRSSSVPVRKVRARRFKLIVNQGQTGGAPQLAVGWRPDTLVFLAQGEAPFTLATGRSADANEQFPQHRLYGDTSISNLAKDRASTATLGSKVALAGADNLQPITIINWRRILLWLGLALGVAFVGVMAVKVIRDLNT